MSFIHSVVLRALMLVGLYPAAASGGTPSSALERVYGGPVRLPDFGGADRRYADFRMRITEKMKSGPNFAFKYAIVQIGCGTSCKIVYVADLTTGRVYDFPYSGEAYYMLSLSYGVESRNVTATWVSDDRCLADDLEWTGSSFRSQGQRVVAQRSGCDL